MSTITIDGQSVPFEDGETIYEVSRRLERDVPTLCYDDRLEAFGACRLCVVELEGARNPVASCTTMAADGMVVRTATEAIERHRKTLMDLVVSENPKGARIDPLRGLASQELAHLAVRYESDGSRFVGKQSGTSRPDDTNPMILRDYDNCISCYRCVRVCAEREGDYAISVANRGFETQITTEFAGLLEDSDCTFCGQCVQTCPTGALGDLRSMEAQDQPGEFEKTRSICPYCGVGCSVDILTKNEKIVGVQPAMDGPANLGALCVKGQFGWDWVDSDERLTQPLVRKDGKLVPASWEEAWERAAKGFKSVVEKHGRHAVYAVASGRAPHESAYSVQKFVRYGFGTNYVDNCSRA
ncbi:Putative formate dehydrogenase [Planctomycetes bacterium Pla86]|uniref:Formate dehydrogenase n=3 Tax=Engelhardtia mirabilis TaxID=2528011 RepID=A0A518BDY8_9BACT|nr:Putative formate dehydrogenase [Planctomycetes bacterium Pla133]QDU99508.1 Putative formate dehydrogenase [Planctomycetes bacterium Pla86]